MVVQNINLQSVIDYTTLLDQLQDSLMMYENVEIAIYTYGLAGDTTVDPVRPFAPVAGKIR